MARYRTELPFAGPPEVAFDYLSGFETVAEWDPGVSEASRVDPGPVAVGTRFRVVVKTGPLEYVVRELEPGRRIRLVAESSTIRSDDVITVTPADGGTRSTVAYEADLTLRTWAVVFTPLLGLVFRRIGDKAAAGLRAKLDELAAASTA
jgi:carbon monoxide dehydrogenase subunit G